jgi:hypothetical protein
MSPSSTSRAKRTSLSKVTNSANNEEVSQSGSDELSEVPTHENHEYEGKPMITKFSRTEEAHVNYTDPNYSPVKFNTIKEGPFTGNQCGLGYQRAPPKSKIIGLLELENGAKVLMNELHNKYACKVLMSGLSQWSNSKPGTGSPEDFSKKVINQEIALLTQLAGFDPELTTDRIRKAIHSLM